MERTKFMIAPSLVVVRRSPNVIVVKSITTTRKIIMCGKMRKARLKAMQMMRRKR